MRGLAGLLLAMCLMGPVAIVHAAEPPRLMLATRYHGQVAVADYLVSEKLDGVRGRWDGQALWTRGGARIAAPAWFTRGWPKAPLDGELWIARGQFDAASGLIRAGNPADPAWRTLHFMLFDLPGDAGPFEARVAKLQALVKTSGNDQLRVVPQRRFADKPALDAELARVVSAGGEGLMLQRRDARYAVGRSDTLLKYKPYEDAEARVVGHAPGKGKYVGMLGALLVQLPDGRQFRIGGGFTDAQRAAPPPVGAWVTYRYNGMTSKGLPRFARFLHVRDELPPPDPRR
ncbi:DNA ligase-1 [Pseudoxanthomonas sp. GM95]|uniref:DNA ligase n=1 Tax=Pseudoxanthomonas sp. GM95 TaxID=1881043 RepID=UPI0008B94A43|nr:DNA ligase [Pseudoxanthomonas sp. GM95]SEM09901.1 DNA ligase-1 [Pseudoxanthomonas sp. GM95]